MAPWISTPSKPAFKESSAALANLLIKSLISLSFNSLILLSSFNISLYFNSLLAISSEGATGLNLEYCLTYKTLPWWICLFANTPFDFIIFALSDKEGMSLSFIAWSWHEMLLLLHL